MGLRAIPYLDYRVRQLKRFFRKSEASKQIVEAAGRKGYGLYGNCFEKSFDLITRRGPARRGESVDGGKLYLYPFPCYEMNPDFGRKSRDPVSILSALVSSPPSIFVNGRREMVDYIRLDEDRGTVGFNLNVATRFEKVGVEEGLKLLDTLPQNRYATS